MQAEDNTFQPILPQEDIAQMYQRILDTEIAVAGSDQALSNGNASKAGSSAQNLKLAAAMGLTQLMLPFRFATCLLAYCWTLVCNMFASLLPGFGWQHGSGPVKFVCSLQVLLQLCVFTPCFAASTEH